jgi:hypothetical protein
VRLGQGMNESGLHGQGNVRRGRTAPGWQDSSGTVFSN